MLRKSIGLMIGLMLILAGQLCFADDTELGVTESDLGSQRETLPGIVNSTVETNLRSQQEPASSVTSSAIKMNTEKAGQGIVKSNLNLTQETTPGIKRDAMVKPVEQKVVLSQKISNAPAISSGRAIALPTNVVSPGSVALIQKANTSQVKKLTKP